MHKILLVLILLLLNPFISSYADTAQPVAKDPVLEKRVTALAEELRCLVCQNQTIADSHADLAIDLKNQVREKLASGMSDKEVIDFMVERYGDFVLYRPRLKVATMLLWFGPFILLFGGILFLILKLINRRQPEDLSEVDRVRAAELLNASTVDKKDTK